MPRGECVSRVRLALWRENVASHMKTGDSVSFSHMGVRHDSYLNDVVLSTTRFSKLDEGGLLVVLSTTRFSKLDEGGLLSASPRQFLIPWLRPCIYKTYSSYGCRKKERRHYHSVRPSRHVRFRQRISQRICLRWCSGWQNEANCDHQEFQNWSQWKFADFARNKSFSITSYGNITTYHVKGQKSYPNVSKCADFAWNRDERKFADLVWNKSFSGASYEISAIEISPDILAYGNITKYHVKGNLV